MRTNDCFAAPRAIGREERRQWFPNVARPRWDIEEDSAFDDLLAEMWEMPGTEISPADISSIDVADDSVALEQRFREEADKWARETAHLSSPSQKASHPSYSAILGMAAEHRSEIIRLLLCDLQVNRRPWFWALSYLTHVNPISPAEAGRFDKMIAAWVNWGKKEGLL